MRFFIGLTATDIFEDFCKILHLFSLHFISSFKILIKSFEVFEILKTFFFIQHRKKLILIFLLILCINIFAKFMLLIYCKCRCKEWNLVLHVDELLFSLPVFNAKVECFFFVMNTTKANSRKSLKQKSLSNLKQIHMEE